MAGMTIILELPDDADDGEDDDLPPLSQDDLESVGRGLVDADAGRVMDADTSFAKMRRDLGLPPR